MIRGADRVLAEAAELAGRGEAFVLATVVWRQRPTSGKPGAKAVVHRDGRLYGWVGGSCAAPVVVREALRALEEGSPRILAIGERGGDGLQEGRVVVPQACASEGAMEIFLDPQLPSPRIVSIGTAPVLGTLGALAEVLGFETVRANRAAAVWAPSDLQAVGADPRSFVVVATLGDEDEDAVAAALGTPAPYVALVASRQRAEAVRQELRRRGLSAEDLERLRAPAGLDLGPVAHDEIAVAILGEIVQHKARGLARGAGAVERPASERDPVCGMEVEVESARHTAIHAERSYVFCCAGCRDRFLEDPGSYA